MDIQRVLRSQRSSPFLRPAALRRILLGLSIALLVTLFLFSPPVLKALTAPIAALGLDPLTARLIATLILVTSAALLSSMGSRQRLGPMIGTAITYSLSYMLPFLRQELLPHYDPGGHLEVLNTGMLAYTMAVLLASGLLCAFLGTAIGEALGEVLFDPIRQLVHLVWHRRFTRFRSNQAKNHVAVIEKKGHRSTWSLLSTWIGLFTLLGLFLLSRGIGDLLFYSPDVGLHNPPLVAASGTLVAESMVSPALHGQHRSFQVYLPPAYQHTAQQYPALYLLHGSPGSQDDWIRGGKAAQSADTLIGHGEIPPLIMIFPDGNGRSGETSEWGNTADHLQLMENFVAFDLVHYIDQKYRTIPQASNRAIGGFSMGGFGAMNIAVHHPDIFGSVISLAGYYTADGSVWGQQTAYRQANSPAFVLPGDSQAWKLHIFLGAATEDQPYYDATQQFILKLRETHLNYTFDLQKGYHTWSVWETQLYHALIWLRWG